LADGRKYGSKKGTKGGPARFMRGFLMRGKGGNFGWAEEGKENSEGSEKIRQEQSNLPLTSNRQTEKEGERCIVYRRGHK